MASSSFIDLDDIQAQRYQVCYQALALGVPTGPVLRGVEVVFYSGETQVSRRLEQFDTTLVESAADGAAYTGFVVVNCPLEVEANDYEKFILCNPADGSQVLGVVEFSPTGVPSAIVYYNLDGTAYTGATPERCSVDYELVAPVTVCVVDTTVPATPTYTEYTRVDVYEGDVSNPANFLSSIWQDVEGNVVAAPTLSATVQAHIGSCQLPVTLETGVALVSNGTWDSSTVTGLRSVSMTILRANAGNTVTVNADTGSSVFTRRGLSLSWGIDGKPIDEELNNALTIVASSANAEFVVNYTYEA